MIIHITSPRGGVVPITSLSCSAELVIGSRIMQEWLSSIDPEFNISEITINHVDFKGTNPSPATVLFIRLHVIIDDHKKIVELRGKTVAMLLILHCEEVSYTVLVRQPRIAVGKINFAEIPAGMLDNGMFGGQAAKELKEETGLIFREDELIDLTNHLQDEIYLSPGLLDESCRFFLAERNIDPLDLEKLKGKATGLKEENEEITLEVITLSELPYATRDAKSLLAYFLYQMRKTMLFQGAVTK